MPVASLSTVTSYVLVVLAPFASTLVALRWFSNGHLYSQPMTRLARVGRWRSLTFAEALRHPLYGTSGIMVSLLVGMMLNVPIRAAEYLAVHAAGPGRRATLVGSIAILDDCRRGSVHQPVHDRIRRSVCAGSLCSLGCSWRSGSVI